MRFSSLLIAASTLCLMPPSVFAAPVTIKVDAAKSISAAVPRTIFGTFLEPIGQSIYGGLWAELLTNPSFEENLWSVGAIARMTAEEPSLGRASYLGLPLPWEPLDPKLGRRYEPRWGDAANSWRSLEILGSPGTPTGIKQKIYLPVDRELTYHGSLYVKHIGGPSALRISLRVRQGTTSVLAEAHVDANSEEWHKYRFDLTLQRNALPLLTPADFVIEVEGDERALIDQASLVPADAIHGLDPDEVRLARDLHSPLLRFGGNFTSAYHWRDGVSADPDKRISMLNIAWGMPEYNTFGTDELLEFCRLIDAEPQIALNLGTGSPEEAADWVRYVNERWHTHGRLTWEMGNELWNPDNVGFPTLGELPVRTAAFSRAIRSVDPSARLVATGQDPDHFERWNAAQLGTTPDTFQLLSTHFVVTTDQAVTGTPSRDGLATAAFALPVELGRRLEAMKKQIDGSSHRDAQIAFTEWLFWCCRPNALPAPSFRNMGGAIAVGGFLNMLLTHSAIAPLSDMTGLMEFSGIWKKRGHVYAAPSYYAFSLYSNADIDHMVAVENNAGTYAVRQGISRLPDIDHVPWLDVVATLNKVGTKLTLFCVNRQLTGELNTSISLANFVSAAKARATVLQAADIYQENDEAHPANVAPREETIAVQSGELTFRFPHESVTRIEIDQSK